MVLDHQAGAIPADVEPVKLSHELGYLAFTQVEPLEERPRRVVLRARGPLAENPGDGLAQPDQTALDRTQPGVPGLDHRDGDHTAREAVGIHGYLDPFGILVFVFVLVLVRGVLAERTPAGQ